MSEIETKSTDRPEYEGFTREKLIEELDRTNRKIEKQKAIYQETFNNYNDHYTVLSSMAGIFYSMHVIDLAADTFAEFNASREISAISNRCDGAVEMMAKVMGSAAAEEYREKALEFTDLTTVADRMQGRKIIVGEFVGKTIGWFSAQFITIEEDDEGRPVKVIFATRIIDEEKKHEQKLIHTARTDELTGFNNRRAYEIAILEKDEVPDREDFVYVSLDVNGLKVVNDSLGHAAGDELLLGACRCMRNCLGTSGDLYRVGGDEFVAILYADEERLGSIFADFDDTMAGWSGTMVKSLAISYGYVTAAEMPDATVKEMAEKADQRMYENKSAYYRKTGVDRRGQRDAHTALCRLYTKILKIDVTDDTYQIVNIDEAELNAGVGMNGSLSEWFAAFADAGYVHPDDAEDFRTKTDIDFLRDHFGAGNKSLRLFYRRKLGDGYRHVFMEIIPADDYAPEDQSLFLYVKDIDGV